MRISRLTFLVLTITLQSLWVFASDWPGWRGPNQNGVSLATQLISDWSLDGKNLIWRADFTGRSTPVILNGRVYVIGRVGEKINKQERVVCFDARTGQMLWEHRFNVYLTTVPFPRVGWANLVGDPETGNIYAHGVGGAFICFDRDGRVLWQLSLAEQFGRMSGYGGRTHTPVIDENLVILGLITSGWGSYAPPRHRYHAFDKRTGTLVWISTPGGRPYDLNTYSTPVVATINGQRLLIGGNADGGVYAMKVRTGEKVWGFKLSKRGLNTSVVVDDYKVYATHSEENLDEATMGRVVCINGQGSGDITETHELWRYNLFRTGFASPAIHDGRLYVIDNSANLHCLDAESGEVCWEYNLGTVGKGSPVWAAGRLYVTELNGTFHILQPQEDKCVSLNQVTIELGNRTAEIFSSPAIAYGRIFFASEEGLYCLGDENAPFSVPTLPSTTSFSSAVGEPPATHIQIVPAEIEIQSRSTAQFRVRAYDSRGRFLNPDDLQFSLQGLSGRIDTSGSYTPGSVIRAETGSVVARMGDQESSARVRLLPALPWREGFESFDDGEFPVPWIGVAGKFSVKSKDGNKVLSKPFVRRGIQRSYVYFGPSDLRDYTVQVDIMGTKVRRRIPDMGVIANRYIMALSGGRQELNIHSWASELRMAKSVAFPWEPDVWYTMKLQVNIGNGTGLIRGKVWPRSAPEPKTWSIEVEDPLPNSMGTPGLYGRSYAEIFYDNIHVIESTP